MTIDRGRFSPELYYSTCVTPTTSAGFQRRVQVRYVMKTRFLIMSRRARRTIIPDPPGRDCSIVAWPPRGRGAVRSAPEPFTRRRVRHCVYVFYGRALRPSRTRVPSAGHGGPWLSFVRVKGGEVTSSPPIIRRLGKSTSPAAHRVGRYNIMISVILRSVPTSLRVDFQKYYLGSKDRCTHEFILVFVDLTKDNVPFRRIHLWCLRNSSDSRRPFVYIYIVPRGATYSAAVVVVRVRCFFFFPIHFTAKCIGNT